MNKHCFRLIFSKARGMLMAVSDVATSRTKTQGQTRSPRPNTPSTSVCARLRTLTFSIWAALGMVLPVSALADIVADTSAPASQQADVTRSANGIEQVNIQAASAGGVSRNTYSQFDVEQRGAILNNSVVDTQTELAGWVQANGNLGGREASVILNEVNANHPSQLLGYIEVAGSRAEVIIANAAGITCDGCGFINAQSAVLAAGQVDVRDGVIAGYTIDDGRIQIVGGGLDARDTDYTALMARAVEVNAGLWAEHLNITTGANTLNADGEVIATHNTAQDAPEFAIDVAQLGGMYAGHIRLIGTEAGVGVRNAGEIGASAGEVHITAEGQLINAGQLSATSAVRIEEVSNVDNSGSVYAGSDVTLSTDGQLTNQTSGTLAAAGDISLAANTVASTGVLGAGVDADGRLGTHGDLTVTATETLAAEGQNLSGGDQSYSANSVSLNDSQTQAADLTITARTGAIDLSDASVDVQNAQFNTPATLITERAQLTADTLNITANALTNTDGTINQLGTGDLVLNLDGTLTNRGGTLASNSTNIRLNASTVDTDNGRITHVGNGDLAITTTTFNGTDSTVESNGQLTLDAETVITDSALVTAEQLTLNATTLSNHAGQLQQRGNAEAAITVTDAIDNRDGTVSSAGNTTITTANVDNRGGTLLVTNPDAAANLTLNATEIDNRLSDTGTGFAGLISASGHTTLTSTTVNNQGGEILSQQGLEITATTIDNTAGRLAAATGTAITSATLINNTGTISSTQGSTQVQVTEAALDNQAGRIDASGTTTVIAQGLDNREGDILGGRLAINTQGQTLDNHQGRLITQALAGDAERDGQVQLTTAEFNNDAGLIQAAGALTIDTAGNTFINTNAGETAGLLAQDTLTLNTGVLNNQAGYLGTSGQADITATTINNTQGGTLNGVQTLTLNAVGLDNQGGILEVLGDVTLTLSGDLNNTASLVRAGQALTINAQRVINDNTFSERDPETEQPLLNIGIEAAQLTLTTSDFSNDDGAVRTGDSLNLTSDTLNNARGTLSSANSLDLSTPGQLVNTDGTVIGQTAVTVNADSVTTDGRLLSLGDLTLSVQGDYVHERDEQVQANGILTLNATGDIRNQAALLARLGITLNAQNIDNPNGARIEATTLELNATESLNNRGLLNGIDTFLDAPTVNNLSTGRIYGDHIAIAADTLTNDIEDGNDAAPVIGARTQLDMGVTTLTNRDHGLLFSLGNLNIGAALDEERSATGRADTVNNGSATIEALGNLTITANALTNDNRHIEVAEGVALDDQYVRFYRSNGREIAFTAENVLNHTGVRFRSGNYYAVTRSITEDQLQHSDPAHLLAAGTINLDITTRPRNENSVIQAGANVMIRAANIDNISMDPGTRVITDRGISIYVDPRNYNDIAEFTVDTDPSTLEFPDRVKNNIGDGLFTSEDPVRYRPPARTESVDLVLAHTRENTLPTPSSRSIDAIDITPLLDRPVPTVAAEVTLDNGTTITPISEIPVTTAATREGPATVVRTGGVSTQLPNNSLFQVQPNANNGYLIETDPAFTDRDNWLNSDYLFDLLFPNSGTPDHALTPPDIRAVPDTTPVENPVANNGTDNATPPTVAAPEDHAITQQRLGDGFYEQRLIREQVSLLTGHRFLEGYSSDEAQFQALMDNAATYIGRYDLRPGIALTAEQMAQLTSDIVWLVEKTFTLPDGTKTTALVPQVYLRVREGDVLGNGTLISGNYLQLDLMEDLNNTGTLAGRQVVDIEGQTLNNFGRISARDVSLHGREDINNIGGQIDGQRSVQLRAERDIRLTTTTRSNDDGTRVSIDRVASVHIRGDQAGRLVVNAGRDLDTAGARIQNGPTPEPESEDVDDSLRLLAGGRLRTKATDDPEPLTALVAGRDLILGNVTESVTSTTRRGTQQGALATTLNSRTDTLLQAERDLTSEAAQLSSDGDMHLHAGNNLNLNARVDDTDEQVADIDVTTLHSEGQLTLNADNDMTLQAAQLDAGDTVQLTAGNDLHIEAITDHDNRPSAQITRHTVGTVNSDGNVIMNAGNDLTLDGTQLSSEGDTQLHADNDLNLNAVADTYSSDHRGKGYHSQTQRTRHTGVTVDSGNNVQLTAGRDANLTGTDVDAEGSVRIAAERDTNISAVVDSDYNYDRRRKDKSFGRSETTITETLTQTIVGGSIDAGGDVLINTHYNSEGELVSDASGAVNLLGVDIQAGNNVGIAGDEGVTVSGIQHESLDYEQKKKTKFGGFSREDRGSVQNNTHMHNASIQAGGSAMFESGDDMAFVATDVIVDGDINMNVVDELLISAGDTLSQSENWNNSSGFFTSGDVYNKKEHKDGVSTQGAQASTFQAGGNITGSVGSGRIVGSDLHADGNMRLTADSGDIVVDAAVTTTESFSYDKEVSVGLGDLVEGASRPDQLVENKDGRATIKLADATYDRVETTTTRVDHRGSQISANNDVTLIAQAGAIEVRGSDVRADADNSAADSDDPTGGTLGLAAATDVTITSATDTLETETKEVHGSAELSFVVQHQAVEVVKALDNLKDAKDQLQQAKKDYRAYERNLDQLRDQLAALEDEVNNQVPGAHYADLVELREIVDDVEGDKDWYQAGIALAAVNLTSATTAVVQQTAAAAASAGTWGFNAGMQLDIDASKTKTNERSTTAVASNLSGNNILIQTGTLNDDGNLDTDGTQTTIEGSHLNANSNLRIQTGDLSILASQDTTESQTETEHGHITAQMTVYGAAGGASISGSFDRSKASDSTKTHTNSTLNANNIDLMTSGDTLIRGGNVHADNHLHTDIAGNLTVESVQDRSRSRNTSMGISGGISFGSTAEGQQTGPDGKPIAQRQGASTVGGVSGANAGMNSANGMSMTRQTVQSSLTSGGTADVNVDGHTQLVGALLATVDDEGNDLNQLTLNTGSFGSTDLRNTSISSQRSMGLSTSVSINTTPSDATDPNTQAQANTTDSVSATAQSNTTNTARDNDGDLLRANTTNLSASNQQSSRGSRTLGTLGHGNITVGGTLLEQDGELTEAGRQSDSPLIATNRETANTEKELWDSEHGTEMDATLDHRLTNKDGWNDIKEDVQTLSEETKIMFSQAVNNLDTQQQSTASIVFEDPEKALNTMIDRGIRDGAFSAEEAVAILSDDQSMLLVDSLVYLTENEDYLRSDQTAPSGNNVVIEGQQHPLNQADADGPIQLFHLAADTEDRIHSMAEELGVDPGRATQVLSYAGMLATGRGGQILYNEVVDRVAGETLHNATQEAGSFLAAGAHGTNTETLSAIQSDGFVDSAPEGEASTYQVLSDEVTRTEQGAQFLSAVTLGAAPGRRDGGKQESVDSGSRVAENAPDQRGPESSARPPDNATTTRPVDSSHYSNAHEIELPNNAYPGVSRQRHNQLANESLHQRFEADPDFASKMERQYPGITDGVRPGPRGAYPRTAPTRDVTWHHAPDKGKLELLPIDHHTAPGPVQNTLHPDGRGGYSDWGEK